MFHPHMPQEPAAMMDMTTQKMILIIWPGVYIALSLLLCPCRRSVCVALGTIVPRQRERPHESRGKELKTGER